jgi:hypothetical protein
MTEDKDIARIVARVLARLLPHLGADGRRGAVIAVLTGATVGIDKAIVQLRSLLLAGFEVRLVFSSMAEHLYGETVREQLDGFPGWSVLPPVTWLAALRAARAVVVPMLSVNSLSKLAQLVADNQTSNLILHGLFSGKPVIVARNGVEDNPGRRDLGFHRGNGALRQAVEARLAQAHAFGCVLTDIDHLAAVAVRQIPEESGTPAALPTGARTTVGHGNRVVTAGDVLAAHQAGADLRCRPQAIITPLARDAAVRLGIRLLGDAADNGKREGGVPC